MIKKALTFWIAIVMSCSGQATGNLYLVSGLNSEPGNLIVLGEETLLPISGPTTLGSSQYKIAFSPDGSHAYIPNEEDGTVTVIETDTHTIVTTIQGFSAPIGAAVTPDGSELLVTSGIDGGTGKVYIVDTQNFTVKNTAEIRPGQMTSPWGIAITPDGETALIALSDTEELAFFDINSATATGFVPLASQPYIVVISSDGTTAYVSIGSGFQKIDIINQAASPPVLIPVQQLCADLVLSPDDHLLYLQDLGYGVHVVDTSDGSLIASITAPIGFLALSNNGARLLCPSIATNELFIIDALNFTLDTSVPFPGNYWVPGVCPIPGLEMLNLQVKIGKDQFLTQTNIFAHILWTPPEEQPLGYLITRNGLQITTLPANTTSFTDHNLEEGKTYLYEIFAHTESAVIAEGAATAKTGN